MKKDIVRSRDYGEKYKSYLASKMFNDRASYKKLYDFNDTIKIIKNKFDLFQNLDFKKEGVSKKIKEFRFKYMNFKEVESDGEIIAEQMEKELIELGKFLVENEFIDIDDIEKDVEEEIKG